MTEQEIIESNKLIAEFLGLNIITDGISLFDTNYKPLAKYHESWNDLMPVVEKIISMDYVVKTMSSHTLSRKWVLHRITIKKNSYNEQIISEVESDYTNGESLINVIYKGVVEFIKWHNKNKQ